jgi:PAS domain S-box-containing protein
MEDELKVMREELQSTIEQLESSNDQLKASNEEVTAANEELQSANEELETSKEELQSLNEELNTLNARLQEKVEELEGANNDVMNLLSSTHIATVFLDKDLKVKRYTPTVTRLFSLIPSDVGRPAAEILRRFTDETLLDDAALVLAELTSIATEVRAEDGRWYIRRITPYRTQDDRIEGVVVTFTDFTERKQAEEALREAHDRARWLARFPGENPNPVVRVSAEGRVLYSNPVAARLAGWECSVGEPMVHAVLPLVGKAMAEGRAVDEDVVLGGTSYAITVAPISAEGYANIYGRNISDRKRAEDALREIAQRLSRAQEMAHLGSWELDVVKNELTWSDEVYRIFGLEPQAFGATYEAFLERVHPDDRAAVDEAYAGSVREGKDAYEIEHRVVRKGTGEIRWVHEKCQHVRDGTGRIIRSLGMVLDVTERKQGEERIKTSLGEKEVLLKEIHHRVKNNMQVISSLVSLQAEGSEDEAVRGLLRDVTDRVRSMALVHEKLYQSSDLARVDFAEYARSLLSYLWRAHGASGTGVRLDLDLEPVSLAVDAAVPCGLILNELAGNALKHAFLGRSEGQVTVSLHGGAAGPVCLRVRDDGVGLPAGLDWRKTRSLGLRLVQMLTGQLGGTVEVRGGEGTAFEITFGGQQSLS